MQMRLKDGTVMAMGGCSKDAQLERVGQDNKRLCKVGLAVGKREDGSTIWVDVVAWHDTAQVLAEARKGQKVLVIGTLKTREYNEKKYTDLVADFVSVCAPPAMPEGDGEYDAPADDFAELTDDDGDLPF